MGDKLSFKPTIAKPCHESWAAMQGGMRERHCDSCEKQVYNFAAMTAREIERLVRRADGKLCARITRRGDGSLVTLEGRPRVSVAAQVVASASLAMGAAGMAAQSSGEHSVAQPGVQATVKCEKVRLMAVSEQRQTSTLVGEVTVTDQPEIEPSHDALSAPIEDGDAEAGKAILTGTVLEPDGSGPFEGAFIHLIASGLPPVLVKSDREGKFRASVTPGIYEIRISQNFWLPTRINDAKLHAGEQSLQPIRLPEKVVETVTGGALAIEWHYTLATAVRHPLSYLKYLARKL